MAIKMNEVIEGTEETVGMRLRKARDDKGLTRKQVHEQTNIPPKSLEKIEAGTQEATLSRIQNLAELYGVSVQWIMGEANSSKETNIESKSNDAPTTSTPKFEPANENDPLDQVRVMLDNLDDMQGHGFKGVQRGAMALGNEVLLALKHFEPGELLALAHERELHQCEKETVDNIFDLFSEDANQAQEYCGSLEERILDTAMLGVDLYALERPTLKKLADELDINLDHNPFNAFSWFTEPEYMELVQALRPVLKARAVSGNGIDFTNLETFPRRK